jgi:glyoxylate reductase
MASTISMSAAPPKGITVTNTPGVLTEDTADMTMALMLAVPRAVRGCQCHHRRQCSWKGWSPTWMLGHRIYGKRLGIIGMGRIGQAVARRAKAFGLRSIITTAAGRPGRRRRAGGDLLGKPRPDAGAHGRRLGQLPAHAGHLPPAVGAAAEADEARGLSWSTPRAARSSTRTRWPGCCEAVEIAGAGLDVFEHEPRVNPSC